VNRVTGANVARGSVLQFTDADTVHAPDLVTRSMSAMRRTRAQLFSVAGRQELGGFWEKVIQPQIFSILATRYGGTESITKATNVRDKIANGQCFFVTHDSYNAIGGHASVRASVAEDMMLAQKFFGARKRVVVMLGVDQLSTRMYGSLGEIIRGWQKNVFAGGLDSVPFGKVGQTIFPLFLLMPPMMELLPLLALALVAAGLTAGGTLLVWAAISGSVTLLWWILVYVTVRENPLYALAYPLGALVLLYRSFAGFFRQHRTLADVYELTLAIRETSDEGRPVVATDPTSKVAEAYREIAVRAWAELERLKGEARPAPQIVMET